MLRQLIQEISSSFAERGVFSFTSDGTGRVKHGKEIGSFTVLNGPRGDKYSLGIMINMETAVAGPSSGQVRWDAVSGQVTQSLNFTPSSNGIVTFTQNLTG